MATAEEQEALALELEAEALELERSKGQSVQSSLTGPQSAALGLPDFAKNVGTKISENASGLMQAVRDAPGHIANAVNQRVNDPQPTDLVEPTGMMLPMWREYTKNMSPQEKATLAAELGLSLAGGAAGKVIGKAVGPAIGTGIETLTTALGTAGGAQVGREAAEQAGIAPVTSTQSKLERASADFILGAGAAGVGRGAQAAGETVGPITKRTAGLFGYRDHRALKSEAGTRTVVAEHGVGRRQTGAEDEWTSRLVEGYDKWKEKYPEILQGKKGWTEYNNALESQLTRAMQTRDAVIGEADDWVKTQRAQGNPAPLVSLNEIEVAADGAIQKQLDKLAKEKSTGLSGLTAAERENAIQKVRKDFFQEHDLDLTDQAHIDQLKNNPLGGTKVTFPKYLTPGEAADKLALGYEELRNLRNFDDNVNAAAGQNPSVARQNIVEREVYSAYTKALKDALVSKIASIKKPGFEGRAAELVDALDTYHSLRPYKDATERVVNRMYANEMEMFPGSLQKSTQSPTGRFVDKVHDVLAGPPSERSFKQLSTDASISTGNQLMPPEQALMGGAYNAAATAGTAATQALRSPMIIEGATLFQRPPEFIDTLAQSGMFTPETSSLLAQAKNGTAEQRRMAIGAAQIESAMNNLNIFTPSPVPGFLSFQPDGKGGGYITDPMEKQLAVDQVNKIYRKDVFKRMELIEGLNTDSHLKEVPEQLKNAETGPAVEENAFKPERTLRVVAGKVNKNSRVDSDTKRNDPGY